MFAADSLINLRMTRKRPEPSLPHSQRGTDKKKSSSGCLPFDDLKAQVVKRQRTAEALSEEKAVRFNMNSNTIFHRHLNPEDLENAWMSEHEADQVKQNVYESVLSFRSGAMDHQKDCIRGLEIHANPNLLKKKVENGKNFVGLILKQQSFLRGVTGKASDQVLGRMSVMLSEDDAKQAQQEAALDEEEAALLYAEDAMRRRKLTRDVLVWALETHSLSLQKESEFEQS